MFIEEYNPYDEDLEITFHPCNFEEDMRLCAVCSDTTCHLHPLEPFRPVAEKLPLETTLDQLDVPF